MERKQITGQELTDRLLSGQRSFVNLDVEPYADLSLTKGYRELQNYLYSQIDTEGLEGEFMGMDNFFRLRNKQGYNLIDFSGSSLIGMAIPGMYAPFLIAINADLTNSELCGATLYGADLRGANLSNSNLWNAKLRYANLSGVDVRGADMDGADIEYANYWYGELLGAENLPWTVKPVKGNDKNKHEEKVK